MTGRNLGITYKPKIPFVKSGECNQTIRRGRRWAVGDIAHLFTWSGKPYYSKWSWRRDAEVIQVIPVKVMDDFFVVYTDGVNGFPYLWFHAVVDEIARLDFIDPPSGIVLRNILLHTFAGQTEGQIIRWKP